MDAFDEVKRVDAARAAASTCVLASSISIISIVDRDAPRVFLRPSRFREGDSENAVPERCANLVLIDVPVKRYPPFEMAVVTLTEPPIVFFDLAFLFSIDREHVVRQLDPHVLLIQTGELGDNF